MWTQILGTVVGPVANLINSLHTSEEEKIKLNNELQQILKAAELESQRLEADLEKEITKRHLHDMTSDSYLSRNIRPLILLFLTIVFAIMSLSDGNIGWGEYVFTIEEAYIPVYQNLLIAAYSFYFGSKAVERTTKIWGNRTDKEKEKNGR